MSPRGTTPPIDRDQALEARAVTADVFERAPLPHGGQRITFWVTPGKWHRRLLRLPERVQRSFEFAAFGADVLDLCDGRRTVNEIVETFVRRRKLDPNEGRKAVLVFLRSLVERGIVAMVVPRRDRRSLS